MQEGPLYLPSGALLLDGQQNQVKLDLSGLVGECRIQYQVVIER